MKSKIKPLCRISNNYAIPLKISTRVNYCSICNALLYSIEDSVGVPIHNPIWNFIDDEI